METCFVNLIEPGDEVVVCVNGVFGTRMSDIVEPARRAGSFASTPRGAGRSTPRRCGRPSQGRRPKVVAVVHAETSTGVRQPLEDLGGIAHQAGALFLVDTVTSLGGMEVAVDRLGIDAVLQRHAEVPVLPAGTGAHLVQPRRAGGPEAAQDAGA